MSAHVNQDQSTRMFKVVAIGSTEEYILGDTVEPVIPEPGLKYDADKLDDVQVKCKTEPEDTDSKKNVIQDLVKLVKLEHSGNLLEENPFMILQNEPPWDDDDLERKLDQFTNELKNKERKLKSHKMTTDAISSPQVKFQSNDVHPRSIRRNLVQTKLKFPKVEDTNMTLRQSPRKVSVVCKNNELKKSLGVNKEQQCKIPLKSLEIIEIDESSSDNDREENCISEHMEDKSDTQHRSTNSKSPSNIKHQYRETTGLQNWEMKFDDTLLLLKDEENSLSKRDIEISNKTSQVAPTERETPYTTEVTNQLIQSMVTPQEKRKTVIVKNVNLCNSQAVDNKSSVSLDSLHKISHNNLPKQPHSYSLDSKHYFNLTKDGLNSVTKETLKCLKNNIKKKHTNIVTKEIKTNKDYKRPNEFLLKKLLSSTSPRERYTIKPNLSFQQTLQPVEVIEVLGGNSDEVPPVIKDEPVTNLNNCILQNIGSKCTNPIQINEPETSTNITEHTENNAINNMFNYNKDFMSSGFGKNFNFPHGQNKSDKLNQSTQLKQKSEVLKHYDDVAMPSNSRNEPKYICKPCNKTFSRPSKLKEHLDTHSGFKKYACLMCCKAYTSRSSLKYHNQNVHSTACHKCSKCGKEYRSSWALRIHVNRYHSESARPISEDKCELCQKTFKDKGRLNEHKLVKHSIGYDRDLNFICHYCSSKFLTKEILKSHIFKLHMPPMFKCEKCSESFTSKPYLVAHLRKAHLIDNRKSYICETCGKVMKSHSFKTHLSIHTSELPFVCDECGKRFRTESNLDQHLRTHSDVRPYKCDLCHKSFRIRHHLRQHLAVHGLVSTARYGKRARKMISSSESNSTDDALSPIEESGDCE